MLHVASSLCEGITIQNKRNRLSLEGITGKHAIFVATLGIYLYV